MKNVMFHVFSNEQLHVSSTIFLFNIAMENPQNKWRFLAGKIHNQWAIYTMAMLNNQRVFSSEKYHVSSISPDLFPTSAKAQTAKERQCACLAGKEEPFWMGNDHKMDI